MDRWQYVKHPPPPARATEGWEKQPQDNTGEEKMTATGLTASATAARAAYQDAVLAHARAERLAAELEDSRPIHKDEAVRRLMDEAAAKGEKLAYTAAERIVEAETHYAGFLKARREATYAERLAYGQVVASKMNFDLALRLSEVEEVAI